MVEIRSYIDRRERRPFNQWLERLDPPVRQRITRILDRMTEGNPGDSHSVGEGVVERRIHFGPGYRIYFAWDGPTLIILLGGGDKSDQNDDIASAKENWRDYQHR